MFAWNKHNNCNNRLPWPSKTIFLLQIIQLLRQRARPYLFSNSLAPAVCGASLKVRRVRQKSSHLQVLKFVSFISISALHSRSNGGGAFVAQNKWNPFPVHGSHQAFDLLSKSSELHSRLYENTIFFREAMKSSGFNLPDYPYPHPIVVRASPAYTCAFQRLAESNQTSN
jgi:7-keto-8-aminopelargonate synthetase-like enzyme